MCGKPGSARTGPGGAPKDRRAAHLSGMRALPLTKDQMKAQKKSQKEQRKAEKD